MQKKQNTIKIKVIGWFILAALAVLLTGIISYTSYRELLRSLENPVTQEVKLKELGNILADITEAEAKMRAYALTRDPVQLDAYQEMVSSINQDLATIKTIEPVSENFNAKIDSIWLKMDKQIEGIANFIALKKNINDLSFSSKALEEISSSTDSIPALRTTTTTTTTKTTVEPLPPADETDNNRRNTKRQQKKRAQEIAKELLKLEEEPQIQKETTITTDTSFVQPDTVFNSIEQILIDLGKEESYYRQLLARKELQLIESSVVIIDQIRSLIVGLERQELALNIERANNAKLIASRSTLTISAIIFVCLLLGILFTYLIFRDVRISDFYNRQLIGAKNQAEQLAESKQQFLANMSHEIRTPLNAILGFTEQLLGTQLGANQKKYLEAVQTSSQHLLHTVNDILDHSKIEAGEMTIDQVSFELGESLREVIAALQLKAQERGLALDFKMDPDQPLTLIGDPFRLKQILFNLVSNGIKFTDQGYVKVRCYHTTNYSTVKIVLSVRDTGIGIPEGKYREIFNDFKQVDPSATRRYQGTGLGLAICKRLVEMQGGSISVGSNGDQGSEFVVKLEYKVGNSNGKSNSKTVDQLHPGQVRAPAAAAMESLQDFNLLVADDDPFNLQLIKTILDKWKARVVYCSNGKEAMEQVEQNSFDLILTDIQMPEVSGIELSRFVRSLTDPEKKKVPIIALTANVIKSDLEKYKLAGIDDFILKPFNENELYQKIKQAVPGKSPLSDPHNTKYQLDDLKKFSAGDDKAMKPMLKAFHENLKQNMVELSHHAKHHHHDKVAELAHKMISSFGHVHAIEPVKKLRELETAIKSKTLEQSLEIMVDEVWKLSEPVLEGLEQEISVL